MNTLSHIHQELAHLDQHQLQQVVEFIEKIQKVSYPAKKLTDFYGIFTARSIYSSKAEMRQSVSDHLAKKHGLDQG